LVTLAKKAGKCLPRKIRELKADLQQAGFVLRRGLGKGSYSRWKHPLIQDPVTLSGHDGDDDHIYQERSVQAAISAAREAERRKAP
jgi:predicted RNA binding protein YcfA (HicA-like mRNA interferase family)